MSVPKSKGPIVDPGMCRCCNAIKKCRLLNVEYEFCDEKEVYSDIIMDTFGLLLSHQEDAPEDRLICATCVTRLRDAAAFRKQVLSCEERLLHTTIRVHELDAETESNPIKEENDLKPELVPDVNQTNDCDDDPMHDDDDLEESDTPLIEVNTSKKRKLKKKPVKSKKKKSTKETRARELLKSMDRVADQLERLQELDKIEKLEQKTKSKDNQSERPNKASNNTVLIVENSFVCPFDTSFSEYYCMYCRDTFTDPDKLRSHTSTHDPKTYKTVDSKKIPQIDITRIDCRLCPTTIDNIDDLKQHLTLEHNCQFEKDNNDFLKFKLTANNISCIECGMGFSFFHALKKHMAEHFGTCTCDICGAHYFDERVLALHQKSHQKVQETYPCKECGKEFKSKHSRNLHEARLHKKEAAYQCAKCDEVLFTYALRYRHMIEVHGKQQVFQCEHCERAYDTRKSLREHNRRLHQKILKHACELCDKRFYLPSRLREHEAAHSGERVFRCECCGKCYPRLRGLKVHMQTHEENKFRCNICGASFSQRVNLKCHMRGHGTEEECQEIA